MGYVDDGREMKAYAFSSMLDMKYLIIYKIL